MTSAMKLIYAVWLSYLCSLPIQIQAQPTKEGVALFQHHAAVTRDSAGLLEGSNKSAKMTVMKSKQGSAFEYMLALADKIPADALLVQDSSSGWPNQVERMEKKVMYSLPHIHPSVTLRDDEQRAINQFADLSRQKMGNLDPSLIKMLGEVAYSTAPSVALLEEAKASGKKDDIANMFKQWLQRMDRAVGFWKELADNLIVTLATGVTRFRLKIAKSVGFATEIRVNLLAWSPKFEDSKDKTFKEFKEAPGKWFGDSFATIVQTARVGGSFCGVGDFKYSVYNNWYFRGSGFSGGVGFWHSLGGDCTEGAKKKNDWTLTTGLFIQFGETPLDILKIYKFPQGVSWKFNFMTSIPLKVDGHHEAGFYVDWLVFIKYHFHPASSRFGVDAEFSFGGELVKFKVNDDWTTKVGDVGGYGLEVHLRYHWESSDEADERKKSDLEQERALRKVQVDTDFLTAKFNTAPVQVDKVLEKVALGKQD